MTRISSLDPGYQPGDLSLFPEVLDDKLNLYEAKNNAVSKLSQTLPYNGKSIIVEDASKFPQSGLIRIGPAPGVPGQAELVYYGKRTNTVFKELIRAFAGSRQDTYPIGSYVSASVMAEHTNAVRDALLNIQKKVGTKDFPTEDSLNGTLKRLENRFLSPKPLFRAFPRKGKPGIKVRFQNFSEGNAVRYLWDFGDGTQSIERSPEHTFLSEGLYTIRLSVITTTGARGTATKYEYIKVSEENQEPFFYVMPADPSKPNYSVETAERLVETGENPDATAQVFNFVDQSDGSIIQRFWLFDDGESESQVDADIHATTHTFASPGTYTPSLLVIYSTENPKRAFLTNNLVVL